MSEKPLRVPMVSCFSCRGGDCAAQLWAEAAWWKRQVRLQLQHDGGGCVAASENHRARLDDVIMENSMESSLFMSMYVNYIYSCLSFAYLGWMLLDDLVFYILYLCVSMLSTLGCMLYFKQAKADQWPWEWCCRNQGKKLKQSVVFRSIQSMVSNG